MIDSGDAQELVDGPVKFINCDDQGLYYISSRDNPEIYRIDYDGQNRMKLNNNTELNPFYLNIAGNWVYYIDRSSKTEQLYRIHKDGGQPELVGGEYNGP
jgi:Tol biopolymer transport system component